MRKEGEDLRRYPRSSLGFVGVEDTLRPGVLNHVDNISCSGVLCRTSEPIPLMTKTRIVLELPRPNEQRIETDGVIVRCDRDSENGDHYNVAILYQRLSDDGYQAIKTYVDHDIAEKATQA